MPLHDIQCTSEWCDYTLENEYIPLNRIDDWSEWCPACDCALEFDLRIKTKRNTRAIPFPEFVAEHTLRTTGKREIIKSLADIRRIEKDNQDQDMCFEHFSFDGKRGNEAVPEAVAKPVRMTEQQKRDFIEKYRDMNIKSERSARDYR